MNKRKFQPPRRVDVSAAPRVAAAVSKKKKAASHPPPPPPPPQAASNFYTGHRDAPVELSDSAAAAAADWPQRIATRTPTKFAWSSSPASRSTGSAAELTAAMASAAGDAQVRVEWRRDAAERFGVGNESWMRLDALLARLAAADERLYLSAQPHAATPSGLVRLAASPLAELVRDGRLPARPEPLAELVPANVNVWLGFARDGASSGLHHDYHDNLYVLLAGEKEFLLVAPCFAERCYTYGDVVRVHANGLINYAGADTRADGATPFQVRRFAHRRELRRLEAELDAAERELADDVPGAKLRVFKAGKALLALAPLAADDDDDAAAAKDDDLDDDLDDDDDDGGLFGADDDDGLFGDNNDEFEGDDAWSDLDDQRDDFDDNDDDAADAPTDAAAAPPQEQQQPPPMPPSFSRIAHPLNFDAAQFPLFVGVPVHRVTLKAGDALFLPAGWFHCVQSKGGLHCALNWWFNPGPYEDGLFDDEWQERIATKEVPK